MKFSEFKTDESLEVEGVVTELPEGAWVCVARANNTRFIEALKAESKPYLKQIRLKKLPDETATTITVNAGAKALFLGFGGFVDDDGKPMKDTEENRREMLRVKDFRDFIWELADEQEKYRKDVASDGLGN